VLAASSEISPPAYGRRDGPPPLISFGIPAYNRPALLTETLASIASLEDCSDYEIVVCDDGALPETRAIVEKFPPEKISFYPNRPPLGAVGNWNKCIDLARGKWVMILHEDDLLYPWYYRSVESQLRDDAVAVCTRTVQGDILPEFPAPSKFSVKKYPPPYFLKSAMTPFPGVLFQRSVASKIGGFNPRWGPLADYDFWYRLACAGPVKVVRQVGAFYRRAPGQWTEREWPGMLRATHLMRLRVAREQFPARPRLGRWFARFFTYRNALAYAQRFAQPSPALARALQLKHIPLSSIPSGWAWVVLKTFS
jgi:glycosyltransferase involved in cell wall biosynthesis